MIRGLAKKSFFFEKVTQGYERSLVVFEGPIARNRIGKFDRK